MNQRFGRLVRLGALVALMLSASTLQAITFSLQNCVSCYGAIFEVEATQKEVVTNIWHVVLSMDLSKVNSPNVEYLSAIAIQVAGGSGVENFLPATSFLDGTLTDISANWKLVQNAGVSNDDCSNAGNPQGFLCLEYVGASGSPLTIGASHSWEFDIDLVAGVTPGLASGVIPIRGNWDPANGRLLSDVAATVPEGVAAELPILLSGLLSLIIWRKRASCRALLG